MKPKDRMKLFLDILEERGARKDYVYLNVQQESDLHGFTQTMGHATITKLEKEGYVIKRKRATTGVDYREHCEYLLTFKKMETN